MNIAPGTQVWAKGLHRPATVTAIRRWPMPHVECQVGGVKFTELLGKLTPAQPDNN